MYTVIVTMAVGICIALIAFAIGVLIAYLYKLNPNAFLWAYIGLIGLLTCYFFGFSFISLYQMFERHGAVPVLTWLPR